MTLEDCLPEELRGPGTKLTRIAAGLSRAGVYRVEAGGRSFVLKVASEAKDDNAWRVALHFQRLAAAAGLTPRLVHIDEGRRAVLTDFVADRGFPAFYLDPRTHEAAVGQLGDIVRRIHALPSASDGRPRDPLAFIAQTTAQLKPDFPLPSFVGEAIDRMLSEAPPPIERSSVISHNDLNPSNLVYDGEAIQVLDWAAAGPMDPSYDLATLAVFLRMEGHTCLHLLSAYEDQPVVALPARFLYSRRLVATLAGTKQLEIAQRLKHPGATGAETLASTLSLGEFYQRMRAGAVTFGTADGQWAFGLTLLKESLAL